MQKSSIERVLRGGGSSSRLIEGFTLAEVLITLGIIGVVAALTLPTLIQHHRRSVVETRLSKFYSIMNQAVQMAELEHGEKNNWFKDGDYDLWGTYLKSYVKYSEEKSFTDINGKEETFVYLSDGSGFVGGGREFYFYPDAKKFDGANQYNHLGQICFRFAFYPNEDSDALKFHKNKGLEPYTGNWNGNIETLYSESRFGCNNEHKELASGTDVTGSFCAAVIQRNGWKIPEDYPFKF